MQLILGCRFLKLSLRTRRFTSVVEEENREDRQREAQEARTQELIREKFAEIPNEIQDVSRDLRACVEQMVTQCPPISHYH
eukprot:1351290-Pyramimonas_sp.AAC.1